MPKLLESRTQILTKLHDLIRKKLPVEQTKLVSAFADIYFENVALEALNERKINDLYGALLSHWQLISQRKSGETKIRVYNPNYEQHDWQSTHTIIEIATDDMPFLVDSLRIEINRQGFDIHFMIHLGA